MSVSISIGKQVPKEEQQEAQEQKFNPEVDELASLMAWDAKIKKDARTLRLAELKKKFQELADADKEPESVVFEGEKTRYKFGKPAKVRTVTPEGKEKFANKVGEEAFLEVVTVPLGAIDKYIPKVEQSEYIEDSLGSRSGKIEAKVVSK